MHETTRYRARARAPWRLAFATAGPRPASPGSRTAPPRAPAGVAPHPLPGENDHGDLGTVSSQERGIVKSVMTSDGWRARVFSRAIGHRWRSRPGTPNA